MTNYIGDFPEDQTVHFKWNTNEVGGASVTRAANGTLYVYKDDATGTEVTTGITDTEDHDSNTGVHHCKIVTTDTFYAAGADYFVVLKSATIDGETVNYSVAHFSIENRNIKANLTQIDGQDTDGNNATLYLKQLDITNSAGTAAIIKSTGSNGKGLDIAGHGTASGILSTGGTTGHGAHFLGGATSGDGFRVEADTMGNGLYAIGLYGAGTGTVGYGYVAVGDVLGAGFGCLGGAQGPGILAYGGSSSGKGIHALGQGTGNGFVCTKGGSGTKDIDADEIDEIIADVTGINGDAMRGTDSAALASVCTETRLAELDAANLPADIDSILDDTSEIGAAGAGLTAVPWNADWDAQVESEVNDALVALGLDHLVAVADADDVVDNSIIAKMVSKDYGTADWSDFDNTTDSLEAIRDRGDQAWKTGSGSGATESYTEDTNWTRTVGDNDGGAAADTVTVNGNYFSTGETTGTTYMEVDVTIDISDGEYATTLDIWGYYAGGGSHFIRVQAYNYTDSTYEDLGVMGLGSSVERFEFNFTPDHTDQAGDEVKIKFLHGGGSGVASHALHIDKMQINTIAPVENDGSGFTSIPWNAAWDTEVESECTDALNAYDPPTNAEMEARTLVAASYATVANQTTIINDTNELQTDWTDGGRLDLILDTVYEDTNEIQGKLPTGDISDFDETVDPVELLDSGGTAGTSAAELVADIFGNTMSELSQAKPAAGPTLEEALMLLYMALRNQVDVDTTGGTDYKEYYNDAGTVICKKAVSDDGSTYTEAEMETGP